MLYVLLREIWEIQEIGVLRYLLFLINPYIKKIGSIYLSNTQIMK